MCNVTGSDVPNCRGGLVMYHKGANCVSYLCNHYGWPERVSSNMLPLAVVNALDYLTVRRYSVVGADAQCV